MSGYGVHRPLLSRHVVVETPGQKDKHESRYIGRCFCGWQSDYLATAWQAGEAVRRHVERHRSQR